MPVINATGAPYIGSPTVEPAAAPPSAFQNIRAGAESFGGATGAALSRLGSELGEAGNQMASAAVARQELFNQVAATDANNKFEEAANKLLYGDPNTPGDAGFYGMRGEQALRAWPDVRSKLDGLLNDTRTGLQNDRQRLQFDSTTRRYRNALLSEMGRHYDRELNTYADTTSKARVFNTGQRAAAAINNGDNAAFEAATAEGVAEIRNNGKLRGKGDDVVEAETRDYMSKRVTDKAEALRAAGNPWAAEQFVDNNKDHLGDDYAKLKERYHNAAREVRANVNAGLMTAPPGMPKETGMVRGGALQNRIDEEAQKNNLPVSDVRTIAQIESSMGQNLGRRGNIFQLGHEEWGEMGGGPIGDTETDIKNGVGFVAKKRQELRLALGREPAGWEIYLAHQQGTGGALALLNNPNRAAKDVVPAANISNNQGDPNLPASAFVNHWRTVFENTKSRLGGPAQQPAAAQPVFDAAGGDSIAAQQIHHGIAGKEGPQITSAHTDMGPGETAAVGAPPATILRQLQKDGADQFAGKTVFWSPGTSNARDPQTHRVELDRLGAVAQQLDLLKNAGAKAVAVPGVGPGVVNQKEVNTQLQKIVEAHGFTFFDPSIRWQKDGIHPAEVDKMRALGAQALAAKPPDQVVGEKQNLPPPDEGQAPDSSIPGLPERLQKIMDRTDLSPTDKLDAIKARRKADNAAFSEANRQRIVEKQLKEVASDEALRDYQKRMVSDSPNWPTEDEIQNDPRLTTEGVNKGLTFLRQKVKGEPDASKSRRNMADLFERIHLPDDDPRKLRTQKEIDEAFAPKGLINFTDHERMVKELNETQSGQDSAYKKRVADSAKTYQHLVRPSMMMGTQAEEQMDPTAKERVMEFQDDLMNQMVKSRDAGKNPYDVLDPENIRNTAKRHQPQKTVSDVLKNTNGQKIDMSTPGAVAKLIGQTVNGRVFTKQDALDELVKRGWARPDVTPSDRPDLTPLAR